MKAQIYQDKAGGWRWRIKAANSRIIAESGEAYKERRKCVEALNRMGQISVFEAVVAAAAQG